MISEKQRAARERNWRIRRLRGFSANAALLRPDRAETVRAIVDEELAEVGAETEAARRERWRKELDAAFAELKDD